MRLECAIDSSKIKIFLQKCERLLSVISSFQRTNNEYVSAYSRLEIVRKTSGSDISTRASGQHFELKYCNFEPSSIQLCEWR